MFIARIGTRYVFSKLGQSGVDRPLLRGMEVDQPLFRAVTGYVTENAKIYICPLPIGECIIPLLINLFLTIFNKILDFRTHHVKAKFPQKEAESAQNPWK